MDITMIGLQNAGKTSLLRVLAVSPSFAHSSSATDWAGRRVYGRVRLLWLSKRQLAATRATRFRPVSAFAASRNREFHHLLVHALMPGHSSIPTVGFNMKRVQKGHVTLKW
jgi:hypothetical protein